MASREEQDRIEALLLMGEYSAYQGYEDIFLCVQARIRKCKFEVEERHPYYLQTLFVHLLKVLKDVTYTNSETFEILLREFDMVVSTVYLILMYVHSPMSSSQIKLYNCMILSICYVSQVYLYAAIEHRNRSSKISKISKETMQYCTPGT